MRALLITVGSRGDAEPFCALAATLATRKHQVDLFLQPEHECLVPQSSDIQVHKLPFTQVDFYRFVNNPSHGADHTNPRVKFIGVVTDCIGELVLPCWEQVLNVAKNASVIITSSLARPLCIALSKKLNIPLCIIHLQPLAPTDIFPHYSRTDECVGAILKMKRSEVTNGVAIGRKKYADSYWELERFQHDFLQERLEEKVYSNLDLPPISFDEGFRALLSGRDDMTLIVNAFQTPEVIPHCSDGGTNLFDIGPLANAYIPEGWESPDDLSSFLEKCEEPPVCVGYGSMPFGKVAAVIEALKEINTKAVLVGDALKVVEDEWTDENTFHVTSVPYAWVLPRCCMLLCHGGAGTVHAALRAGVPVVISPLMGDQFTWARLLEARGLGVKAGSSLNEVTARDIVEGIDRARECRDASTKLGDIIRSKELGVESLADLLELKITSSSCEMLKTEQIARKGGDES